MREKIIRLYQYDELSDKAKARAVDTMREQAADDDWWYESVFDDAVEIAALMGIKIEQRAIKHNGAVVGHKPSIFFSGFSSQGDGACFEGIYRYKEGSVQAVAEYAPTDETLKRIVKALEDVQERSSYRLGATVKHRGTYSHEYCTVIDVQDVKDDTEIPDGVDAVIQAILRDYMKWIYRQLQSEYEYRTGDEAMIEDIRANEMEFTEEGARDHG
jgi:hypothetical protein